MAVAGARIMVKVGAENKYRNFGSATLLILNYKNILKYYFASGIIESLPGYSGLRLAYVIDHWR